MKLRSWLYSLVYLICAYRMFGADANVDYAMSEIGRCSIESLEQIEKRSYFWPNLSITTDVIGECGLVGTISGLCATSAGSAACFLTAVIGGVFGAVVSAGLMMVGGIGLVGSYEWNSRVKNCQHFAFILKQAYVAMSDKDHKKTAALNDIKSFLAQSDPNWETTYVLLEHPVEKLAEKLVLANEAGHFMCWSVLFPDTENPDLGQYAESYGAPRFGFTYKSRGTNDVVHLNRSLYEMTRLVTVPQLLKGLSRETLIAQNKALCTVYLEYKKYLSKKSTRAEEFLEKVRAQRKVSNLTDVQVCPE